jgi:hypothetical protein
MKSEKGLGAGHPKQFQIGTPTIKLQVRLLRSHHGKSTAYYQSASMEPFGHGRGDLSRREAV